MKIKNLVSFIAALLCSAALSATPINSRVITKDLAVPWGMTLINEGQLLVTFRHGDVALVDLKSGKSTPVSGAPQVMARGQGGLLDVRKSPHYAKDHWLYFTYVKQVKGQGATTLARAKLVDYQLTHWQDLLVSTSRSKYSRHFGSRIAFDNSGHVFFSVGDRGVRDKAQDLSNHAGTILRLNLDGTIPKDNPFVGQDNALDAIYSFGHRNPQGLAFDRAKSQLWAIEHGPRGGDELNLIAPGLNYGWPIVSHGKEYALPLAVGEATSKKGYVDPVQVYIPSIAPSSLWLNTNAGKQGELQFLIGALKLKHLNVLDLRKQQVVAQSRHLTALALRIRNVIGDGGSGFIVATDDGQLLQLSINQ